MGNVYRDGSTTFVETAQTWLAIHSFDTGFVLEVGEPQTHGDFATFRRQVQRRSRLRLTGDRITYQDAQGKTVALSAQGDALPLVWRNGQLHDWSNHPDTATLEARLAASLDRQF